MPTTPVGELTYHETAVEQTIDEEDEGLEPIHTSVDALTNFGVQTSDIKKLQDAGVATAEQVLRLTRRKLEAIKGISTAKADKMREAAANVAQRPAFQTAKDLQSERERNVVFVSTGSNELNQIFGGGIESGSITEFYGEFRTGKTQLCMTLCVTSFLPRNLGGGEGRVLYLDTEGTFRPERLHSIAARYDLDHDFLMENVMTTRVNNVRTRPSAPHTARVRTPAARRATRAAKTSLSRACRPRAASRSATTSRSSSASRRASSPTRTARAPSACSSSTRSSRCTGRSSWGAASSRSGNSGWARCCRWSRTSPRSSCVTRPPRTRDAPAAPPATLPCT